MNNLNEWEQHDNMGIVLNWSKIRFEFYASRNKAVCKSANHTKDASNFDAAWIEYIYIYIFVWCTSRVKGRYTHTKQKKRGYFVSMQIELKSLEHSIPFSSLESLCLCKHFVHFVRVSYKYVEFYSSLNIVYTLKHLAVEYILVCVCSFVYAERSIVSLIFSCMPGNR